MYETSKQVAISGAGTEYIDLQPDAEHHAVTISDMTNVTSVASSSGVRPTGASTVWKLQTLTDHTDASNVASFILEGGTTGLRIIATGAVDVDITSLV